MRLLQLKGKLSQTEFSAKIGITQASVSQYLTTSTIPSTKTIDKICRAFDVSPQWLLGMTDQRNSTDQPDASTHQSLPETLPGAKPLASFPRLPVVGTASAMAYDPTLSTLHDLFGDESESVPFAMPDGQTEGVFCLKIEGDSMLPTLRSGDIVACKDELPATGDLCVAMVRGDGLVCKRWYWRNGIIKLIADNEDGGGKTYEWTKEEMMASAPIVFRWRVLALYRKL